MSIVSFISGFLTGFVCWISCFLLPKPMGKLILSGFYKLKPMGENIVFFIMFLFLVGTTILVLMLYPLYGFTILDTGVDEFYYNIKISFVGSIVGFLCLLLFRLLVKNSIKNSENIE
jgi:hypothetical protein